MVYLNKKQAAEKLFVSVRTLDRMRAEGKIKAYVISERKIRYNSDEIDEFIKSTREV